MSVFSRQLVDPRLSLGGETLTECRVLEDKDRDGGYYAYEIESPTNRVLKVALTFQNGSWREVGVNGIFVEDLLVIARDKLERSIPEDRDKRGHTEGAIAHIARAIDCLMARYGAAGAREPDVGPVAIMDPGPDGAVFEPGSAATGPDNLRKGETP